jgi:hypothetical protein
VRPDQARFIDNRATPSEPVFKVDAKEMAATILDMFAR